MCPSHSRISVKPSLALRDHNRQRVDTVREDRAALTQQAQNLYERYVRPLEQRHKGRYVAVSEEGKIVLAASLFEVMEKADGELPPGSYLFKVGDIAIDTWRWTAGALRAAAFPTSP